MESNYNKSLHWFAVLTACCTLCLLVAGALVTSNDAGLSVPDWPLSYGSLMPPMVGGIFYEHGHRMVATLVGMLTIILAVWLQRAEKRPWMRKLGWIALGAVIAQGILGGLTVKFFLPPAISIAHASLAQSFFCLVVGMALFTSRWWQSDLPQVEEQADQQTRRIAVVTVAVMFTQLVLGAAFRHKVLGILPHVIWAVVVLGVALWASLTLSARFAGVPALRKAAALLASLVGAQLFLGGAAYWSRMVTQGEPQPMLMMVGFTVAHVAVGALALGSSVLLALCCFRIVRPARIGDTVSEARSSAIAGLREVAR